MELSEAVSYKYGHRRPDDTLNVSYEPLTILDRLPQHFTNVTVLQLNHCHLTSLQGVEQFTELKHFSFKFNEIGSASELERLVCRKSLTSMNFTGNDIEHLQACRY